jgi:predicted nucleotidyltransferase
VLRPLLIRLALDLQFAPFVWVLQAYYGLAARRAVRAIRRVPGVRAIYLCGSMARGDVVYGLSDIDFKIFVDGPADSGARPAIQERFRRLRRWFPVLGPPDEKGIHSLAGFARDYRDYPLIQHLFDDRFYRHRLLWGEDLLPRLPVVHWSALDQGLTFLWKLKDWTEKISLLAGSGRITRIQKHYLFYKACCDLGLMRLCLDDATRALGSRDAVMEELARRLDANDAAWVRALVNERRGRWRHYATDPESSYLAFKRLVDTCVAALSPAPVTGHARTLEVVQPTATSEADAAHVTNIRLIVPGAFVTVRPWSFLPRSPFDVACTGRPVYVVSPRDPITLSQSTALRAYSRAAMAPEAVLIVDERPGWHYAIDAVLVDHWLGTSRSDDLLGLLIHPCDAVTVSSAEASRLSGRLAAFQEQLRPALDSPGLARLEGRDFADFLFTALRALIVAGEYARGRLWLRGSPNDILEYLRTRTPIRASFLDLLRDAISRTSAGHPFNERLREKSVALVDACLRSIVDGSHWDALGALNDAPDEQRLRVSAVIVTRDRPAHFARCLPTLLGQRRAPDELVVVDSSSNDDTASLVSRCAAPFPVRLVRPSHGGVAAARNAGVDAAEHEIIAFVDDDVVLEPEWLEALEFSFLRDPRIGIAGGSVHHLECGREDAVARFMRVAQKL